MWEKSTNLQTIYKKRRYKARNKNWKKKWTKTFLKGKFKWNLFCDKLFGHI